LKRRLILGVTGASGATLAYRMAQYLAERDDIETHGIISDAAKLTFTQETGAPFSKLKELFDKLYDSKNIGASIASGSYYHDGMMVLPCSIKTLSAVANCYSSDLISRAADVSLKEGRQLLLAVRETPFHSGHLELMGRASKMGAIIYPPIPAFYAKLDSVEKMVDICLGRMLSRMGIENDLYDAWQGLGSTE
jgi:4-hydroxy-3-polyprenylbenzoate decarboxylase